MKHKIITIPIQKQAEIGDIYKCEAGEGYFFVTENKLHWTKTKGSAYQLLLLSDEEIKIEDYAQTYNQKKEVVIHHCKYSGDTESANNLKCPKIIAAYPKIDNLPTFSIEFIKEWCDNPVKEVEIEMEDISRSIIPIVVETIPKLTNGFITIINKDLIKEESDKEIIEYVFNKSKESIVYTEEDLHEAFCAGAGFDIKSLNKETQYYMFTDWFEQNKKK